MSGFLRIKRVNNVEHDKRPQTKPINTSFDKKPDKTKVAIDWQDAFQARGQHLYEHLSISVLLASEQKGSENSNQDSDEQEDKNAKEKSSIISQASAISSPTNTSLDEVFLPLNMKRLAGLIYVFVARSTDHSIWAVQIPLAHSLIQETVLNMRCEQSKLTIIFETPDWHSRETIMEHTPMLLQMLRTSLFHLSEINIFTN